MKKIILPMLMTLWGSVSYALPVGNPSEASLFINGLYMPNKGNCDLCDPAYTWIDIASFRAGFYGDYVFNRNMEVEINFTGGKDLQEMTLSTNAAYLALNFMDCMDVFATMGVSGFHSRQSINVFSGSTAIESELHLNSAFSWSVGARATLWQLSLLALGVEGQYFSAKPKLDHILIRSGGLKFHFHEGRVHYHEWQVSLGISCRIATSDMSFAFIPYIAGKYAKAQMDDLAGISIPTFDGPLQDFRSQKNLGLAVGCSLTMHDLIGVTVEGRFADEKAFYVNAQIRF